MSDIAIKFENISKVYRLGQIGTGTLSHDLKRWWIVKIRGKEDPYLKIGQENILSTHRSSLTSHSSDDYVWALRDINLEVKQGEVLGIIGKNGAGKSTLLKLLSRVTMPTTGVIKAKGRIASLLEVGTGFHLEMTGRENIFMNGSIMGMNKVEIKKKFDEIVDFAGVEKYIDTPVKRYSSGMTVRLGFAVAAHLEPEILVVDEVLAVGDAEFQKKAIVKIQDISNKKGRTVLFVSHNMTAIVNLSSNLCILNNGVLDYLGSVETGINKYLSSVILNADDKTIANLNYSMFPDDEEFKLIELHICDENSSKTEFYTNQQIYIKYIYQVKKKIRGLRVGFDLIDFNSGITVFRTFHNDQSESGTYDDGIFSSVAHIPSNLLKPGKYIINVAIGIHNIRWISFDRIAFQIYLYNINGINKQYADPRPGVIMPNISWDTVLISK